MAELTISALDGLPQVRPFDDLCGLLIAALQRAGIALRSRDILVVTSKIVAKAEGRYRDLAAIEPSARARAIARTTNKDARLVEAVLSEAAEVLRAGPNLLIVVTHHGLIMANAGIDQSNLEPEDDGRRVLLLPEAPDRSAPVQTSCRDAGPSIVQLDPNCQPSAATIARKSCNRPVWPEIVNR